MTDTEENIQFKPAVLYAAKSTEDEKKEVFGKGSMDTQREDGRKLAAGAKLTVVDEFEDENKSAYHGNRGPNLEAAMALCERMVAEHGSCALIVQHSDRLARGDVKKARHLIEIVVWAIKQGVELRSVQDPGTFSGEGNVALLMGVVGGMRNNEDSERKSKSVSDGLVRRAANGGRLSGGIRPYGYRWVPEVVIDKRGKQRIVSHLEQVPAEAEVVKRIFNETCKRQSQRSLARMLDEEGIPATRGGEWTQGRVSSILRNPLYKGEIRHKGEIYKGVHQAIVSEDDWNTAQKVRQQSVRRAGGRWPKGAHLLTKGLLRCGQCGWAMVPRTSPGPGRSTYEAYECHGKRTRGLDFCDQPNIAREMIDGPLLADLTKHYIDLDETRRQIEAKTAADLTIARESVVQADREAAAAEAKLARVRSHYQSERITPEDWSEQRPGLMAGVEAAQQALGRARSHLGDVERSGGLVDGEEALLRQLATIRSAVSNGIGQARDLNTLRLILGDMFSAFELIKWPGFGTGSPDGYAAPPVQKIEVKEQTYALLPRLRWNSVDVEGGLLVRKAVLPINGPERLGHEVIATAAETAEPVELRIAAREHDQR